MNPSLLLAIACAAAPILAPFDAHCATTCNPVVPAVTGEAQPFELKQVCLLEGPFRDAMLRDKAWLEKLNPDRLLYSFRLTAGLPNSVEPYGGKEQPKWELRGHSLGHYLSACALMVSSTGDAEMKRRTEYLVAELAKCQEAMPAQGFHAGYLSAYPEEFFDRVDACKPVQVPYYTLHKIMAGLLDVYKHCGNQQALEVLLKLADWVKFRVDRLTPEQMQLVLNIEHGGMNEVLANLYAVTGNPDHLRLAKAFNHQVIFTPLARGEDQLDGLHANSQIPKVIGAAREYELTGEKELRDIAKNFWQFVALNRSYCIGGDSEREHFFPVDAFSQHLGMTTAETCNTYNMLKLTRHLFAWEPSAKLMDYYERALFNHILGSQDPKTGMVIYFASLMPGYFKDYCTPEDSFWCCGGTGFENHAKYGETIYYHQADTLFVNLFIASELSWKEKQVQVRQETRFPESDTVRLTFDCPKNTKLAVKIRRPAWAGDGASLRLNGKPIALEGTPGYYLAINRQWDRGDVLEVRFPMTLRTEAMPDNPHVLALLYGPIALAGELGTEGLEKIVPYTQGQYMRPRVSTPNVPVLVCDGDLLRHIQPIADKPLAFRTEGIGQPKEVTLIPYYQLHHQRFTVYWEKFSPQEWSDRKEELAAATERRRKMEARIVDEVQPGEQEPEFDHALRVDATSTTGYFKSRKWRAARGWFGYDVAVTPDQPVSLRCTYWGDEAGRVFDIWVDGVKVAGQTLDHNQPNAFFDVDYPVPAELTKGKRKVRIKFQARQGSAAGGLFHLLVLKP